ncbi:MAG: HAD family hydrolase [bacterium]|nr:HAD family hydrolase [bacterium]
MKVVFLDRDGVINKRLVGDYVKRWSEFQFLPYAKRAIRKLTEAGYQVHVTSNQQGVGKGLMTKQQLDDITRRMLAEIEQAGGKIHSVAYCHHTESDNCTCRKPKPGLLIRTANKYKLRLTNCWMVGDSERDIQAGTAVGCKTILIGNYKIKNQKSKISIPTFTAKSLLEAVNLILKTDTISSNKRKC